MTYLQIHVYVKKSCFSIALHNVQSEEMFGLQLTPRLSMKGHRPKQFHPSILG